MCLYFIVCSTYVSLQHVSHNLSESHVEDKVETCFKITYKKLVFFSSWQTMKKKKSQTICCYSMLKVIIPG